MNRLIMSLPTILSVLSFLALPSIATAQSFCPLPYPDANGVAACAADDNLGNKLLCPTQEECDRGWQWAAPNSAMTTYPLTYSDSQGLQICYLSGAIGVGYEPKCPSNFPSSVTLYAWCQRLRDLGAVEILNFNLVGVCGSAIPRRIKQTLEMAPGWVDDKRPGRKARLLEVLRWAEGQ